MSYRSVTVLQNAVVANGNGLLALADDLSAAAFQVTGAGAWTVNFEASVDGTTFVAMQVVNVATGGQSVATSTAGVFQAAISGLVQVRARVSGWASGTVTVSVRLTSADPPETSNQLQGAASVNVGQQTTSTVAATLFAARQTRTGAVVKNLDAAITVYIGPATVTAANGLPLKAGESIPITWTGLVQVIAASGTPVVAFWEEFN